MKYPAFFDDVEKIKLYDPLSEFLGTFDQGIIKFSYPEIVKSAGHSCPTVAGAYLMTLKALKALYKNELPQRGSIKVMFKENSSEGITGVIALVIGNITGATENMGFKGIGGKFDRRNLMKFIQDISGSAKFIRTDTGKSVNVYYNPSVIPPKKEMNSVMTKIQFGTATTNEKKLFEELWQERVKRILIDHFNNEELVRVEL